MRCPACQAFTRFVGIAWVPGTWIRYELCERCEALFFLDATGRRLGGRKSVDAAGYPFWPALGLRPAGRTVGPDPGGEEPGVVIDNEGGAATMDYEQPPRPGRRPG